MGKKLLNQIIILYHKYCIKFWILSEKLKVFLLNVKRHKLSYSRGVFGVYIILAYCDGFQRFTKIKIATYKFIIIHIYIAKINKNEFTQILSTRISSRPVDSNPPNLCPTNKTGKSVCDLIFENDENAHSFCCSVLQHALDISECYRK